MIDGFVIVGSGMASITLVREIRKIDRQRDILVLTADDGSFYSKPNLSNAFAAGKDPAGLVVTPAAKLEKDLSIQIRPHVTVTGIDAPARTVRSDQGNVAYGRLVLAVGASQIRLPLKGDGADDVVCVNSLDDYRELRRRLDGKRTVAIIGAGLIGCEFANDLRLGGYEVTLFDTADRPLARLLPPIASDHLRRKLEEAGIVMHLGTPVVSVEKDDGRYALMDTGKALGTFDLVLSAVGLRPNLALAMSAGLKTGVGIRTDRCLATSDPDIFALGDCVEMEELFLPYVMPILQGAKSLAATLTGKPEPLRYPAMPVVVKTPACPTVVCPPPAGCCGHWDQHVTDAGVRALFLEDGTGRPVGFLLQGGFTKERMSLAAMMPGLA